MNSAPKGRTDAAQPVAPASSGTSSNPSTSAHSGVSSAHARLTRMVGLLLFLQIILLFAFSFWMLRRIDWDTLPTPLFSQEDVDAFVASFWFIFAGALLLLAAIGLIFLRRFAWILAMSIQILLLTFTLVNYFWGTVPTLERAYRMFAVMGSAVVLVFYLNLEGVRTAVRWRGDEGGSDAADQP